MGQPAGYQSFVERLADELVGKAALTSGGVNRAFRAVPRHLFIDHAQVRLRRGWSVYREVDCDHRRPTPEVLTAIYSDRVLRLKQGSTSSRPSRMALMLEDLGVRPGMRVLEIGTGSGYNAALLAEVVGDPALVHTVELDPGLAATAREHLAAAGYGAVTVRAGDGAAGMPDRGPFDAVMATAGCEDLAPAWVEQLAEGGRILCPLHIPPFGAPSLLVQREGGRLRGRFTREGDFVPLHSDEVPYQRAAISLAELHALSAERAVAKTTFPPDGIMADRASRLAFGFFLEVQLGGQARLAFVSDDSSGGTLALVAETTGQACVLHLREGRAEVIGPPGLLERLEQACSRWPASRCRRLQDYEMDIRPRRELPSGMAGAWLLLRRHYAYLLRRAGAHQVL